MLGGVHRGDAHVGVLHMEDDAPGGLMCNRGIVHWGDAVQVGYFTPAVQHWVSNGVRLSWRLGDFGINAVVLIQIWPYHALLNGVESFHCPGFLEATFL